MGPVGMLIIQRTLSKGRWPAFFTGIGAAFSDLIYSLVTGFGLSFIGGFLEDNQCYIQVFGSLVIVGFALYLFQRNPSRALQKTVEQHRFTFLTDIVTGFLFTFANPLIIFFIIGLYGRFNFLAGGDYEFYHYLIGYAAIFIGALSWWWLITTIVNKLRRHFNVRSLWILNKVIGSILFIMAVVGIVHGINDFIQNHLS